MDDYIAFEILEHSYAIVLWMYNYAEKNNLPLAGDEDIENLRFHLARLQSLTDEINHPLTQNPILTFMSRKLTDRKSPEDETEPAKTIII
jgi:hypothetical protein